MPNITPKAKDLATAVTTAQTTISSALTDLDARIVAKIENDAAMPARRQYTLIRAEVERVRQCIGPLRTASLNIESLAAEIDRLDPPAP